MNSKEVVLAFWDAMKTNDFAKAGGLAQILRVSGRSRVNSLLAETTSRLSILITLRMVFGSLQFTP